MFVLCSNIQSQYSVLSVSKELTIISMVLTESKLTNCIVSHKEILWQLIEIATTSPSRFSRNSEADSSELLEIPEEMIVPFYMYTDVCCIILFYLLLFCFCLSKSYPISDFHSAYVATGMIVMIVILIIFILFILWRWVETDVNNRMCLSNFFKY